MLKTTKRLPHPLTVKNSPDPITEIFEQMQHWIETDMNPNQYDKVFSYINGIHMFEQKHDLKTRMKKYELRKNRSVFLRKDAAVKGGEGEKFNSKQHRRNNIVVTTLRTTFFLTSRIHW